MSVPNAVASAVEGHPGRVAVQARNLMTGEVVAIDADEVMPTESALVGDTERAAQNDG